MESDLWGDEGGPCSFFWGRYRVSIWRQGAIGIRHQLIALNDLPQPRAYPQRDASLYMGLSKGPVHGVTIAIGKATKKDDSPTWEKLPVVISVRMVLLFSLVGLLRTNKPTRQASNQASTLMSPS